jgi:hypothetical protein
MLTGSLGLISTERDGYSADAFSVSGGNFRARLSFHCPAGSGFAITSLGGMRVTFRRRMLPSKGVLFG